MVFPFHLKGSGRTQRARHDSRSARRRLERSFRPLVNQLEDRLAPATDIWTGVAGDSLWSTPLNWSTGVPTAGQDVSLSTANGTTAVTIDINSSIGNLTARAVGINVQQGKTLTTTGGTVGPAALPSSPIPITNAGTIQVCRWHALPL